jgi:hypothetical protein
MYSSKCISEVVDVERHYCSFNSCHVDLVSATRLITAAILLDPSLWLHPNYLMSYPPPPIPTTQSCWNMWHRATITNCAMAT